MEIEWIYYFNLLYEEEFTEPSYKVDARMRESKWHKQGIQINWFQIQVISACPPVCPASISHCEAAFNLTLLFFVLWKLLETLKKLKRFIIRLDMQYSNVAWKLNWTRNHLCILRPMPAHSEWITGGLSLFLRDSILNLDRKWFSGAKKTFTFQIFFPLSFTVLNSIKLSGGYLP